MTKERELLEETLLFLDEFEYPTIVEEIRAFLAAEPEADKPMAWTCEEELENLKDDGYCVSGSEQDDLYTIPLYLHPPRPEPVAEPVAWTNQHELNALGTDVTCYMYSEPSFGEMYTENDIPLYLHPPKPVEPVAEPIGYVFQYVDGILGSDIYYTPEEAVAYTEGDGIGIPVYRHPTKSVARPIGYADRHELEEFRSGNYGNFSVQCKEKCEDAVAVFIEPAARKPLTDEELRKAFLSTNTAEPLCEGWPGLERFARAIERHHGITE